MLFKYIAYSNASIFGIETRYSLLLASNSFARSCRRYFMVYTKVKALKKAAV